MYYETFAEKADKILKRGVTDEHIERIKRIQIYQEQLENSPDVTLLPVTKIAKLIGKWAENVTALLQTDNVYYHDAAKTLLNEMSTRPEEDFMSQTSSIRKASRALRETSHKIMYNNPYHMNKKIHEKNIYKGNRIR